MIRYMLLFLDEGWTVVAYDARGHGGSKGDGRSAAANGSGAPANGSGAAGDGRGAVANGSAGRARPLRPSYGWFEKDDLKAVVDWALAKFGGPGGTGGPGAGRLTLVVFGESMGAATALQYAAIDPRVDAVIADCPFSSAMDELEDQLGRAGVFPPFRKLVAAAADAFCRRLEGFSLRDADPARAVLETEVPILFAHGLEDRYVPWRMSVVMAERRRRALPDAVTELLLVPGARHAECIRADRKRYSDALRDFLVKALG
jgi:pimeloyl-ACP methyl ester carboxylesterase